MDSVATSRPEVLSCSHENNHAEVEVDVNNLQLLVSSFINFLNAWEHNKGLLLEEEVLLLESELLEDITLQIFEIRAPAETINTTNIVAGRGWDEQMKPITIIEP
ncbi:hypothetical protein PIB30_095957 [Stylosanthes scabra]|uniref:Uncharacterized protein n=1 Tax=Stylosanthes scabra TaxID=79078 RepID=A0ABU6QV81_9FABA|nr:hypothetical protein [Stylosanthes scabra]